MNYQWKRLLSVMLALALVFSLSAPVLAANDGETPASRGVTWERVEGVVGGLQKPAHEALAEDNEPQYADSDVVRVSIVLDAPSVMDRGYPVENLMSNSAARSYRAGLRAQQDALAETISQRVLGGEKLDVQWNITLAGNIISANVEYGMLDAIRVVRGVKDVVLETRYEPAAVREADNPDMSVASGMTNTTLAWSAGYTGAGSLVAIVDTGLDIEHELFDAGAFDKAIEEVNAKRAEDGLAAVKLMTVADIESKLGELNIQSRITNTPEAADYYISSKIPFAACYVDRDLDVTHVDDTQGEHGSHVAGIATANRYVPEFDAEGNKTGEYLNSIEAVNTQGQAPDAQVLVMKVFGGGGGAYDSDYMVAIEDAMTLGAASVNLSLGSSSAGFTTNATYGEILNKLTANSTLAIMSAGNNYAWANDNLGDLYADDINYHTGGSPSTYSNSLSVASIDNDGFTGNFFLVSETPVFYNESATYGNAPMTTIPGEHDYIYIDGPGVDSNDHVGQEGDAFFALGEDVVKDKIAICNRGSSSFFAKANAAVAQGAIGVIIVNNQPGTLGLNLTGYTGSAPVVSVTQDEGALFRAGELVESDNGNYYTGKIDIKDGISSVVYNKDYVMSGFSSWGGNNALTMKPEITAPGGNIYSLFGLNKTTSGDMAGGHREYENMSGTSMAAPQMAGLTGVFAQYYRDAELESRTGKSLRWLAQSLFMSTSVPVYIENTNKTNLYSIIKQGSGLADINAAINAKSYIEITEVPATAPWSAKNSIADGKVKIEVGEVQTDSFTAAFDIVNFSEDEIIFDMYADFFTQVIKDGMYRLEDTETVNLNVDWTVDGQEKISGGVVLDFNGDKIYDSNDAQYLLDYVTGALRADATQQAVLYNEELADMDGDGDIDTHDAYLAYKAINGAVASVPAGETTHVTVTVSGLSDAMAQYMDYNGNYIEGFLYVQEATKEGDKEGAMGIRHSIPVFGFYGSISDASMYDKGSAIEYNYGLEERDPYMAVPSALGNSAYELAGFTVQYPGESKAYLFGGNPLIVEDGDTYYPERNAINTKSIVAGIQYSAIRNSVGARFYISDQAGNPIASTMTQLPGNRYGAYYYRSQSTWRNTSTSVSIGYVPTQKEGTKLALNYQLAPEYYQDESGKINWDALGKGTIFSIPFVIDNTEPYIVDVETKVNADTGENETLSVIAHDNQYIAAVALYDDTGKLLSYIGQIDGVRRGEQHTYDFALADIPAKHLLVEVYDYAMNVSTWKINYNTEELDDPLTLSLDKDSMRVFRGNSGKLTASAEPWGASDEVNWSSEDNSIATVEDGIVTGVAVGTTTITATSVENPEVTASCEVEVFTIDMTVLGALQDVGGQPMMFTWDLLNDSTWTPAGDLENGLTAIAWDKETDDGAYFYQQDFEGYMHKVNKETLVAEATSEGVTGFGAPMDDIDFAYTYNRTSGNHRAFGVSEIYFLYSANTMENTFSRGWPMVGSYFQTFTSASKFVAMCYGYTAGGSDFFYVLDNDNWLWRMEVTNSTGSLARMSIISTDLQLTYPAMEDTTGNSMVMGEDGNLYLAHYNGSTSELYQLAVNAAGNYEATRLGNVGEEVWPAALLEVRNNLQEIEVGNAIGEQPVGVAEVTVAADSAVELTVENGRYVPAGGSLNAISGEYRRPVADGTQALVQKFQVTTDREETTNGLIEINIPDGMTIESIKYYGDLQSVNDINENQIVFGYVFGEAVEKDTVVAEIVFAKGSTGNAVIKTREINNEHLQDEDTIELPPTDPVVSEWSGPKWNWLETPDGFTAQATFTNKTGNVEVIEAEVEITNTVKPATCTEPGRVEYTATAMFDMDENGETETYTDTREGNVPALGHSYHGEPEWQWSDDYSMANATFTCENCGETLTLAAKVTSHVTEGDCEKAGVTVYTATVTYNGDEFTDTQTVESAAIGHAYGEPEWAWEKTENGYTVTATFICANDDTHVETVTATVTREETPATFTAPGKIVYTATVTFEDKEYTDTKEVEIPQLDSTVTLTGKDGATLDIVNITRWVGMDKSVTNEPDNNGYDPGKTSDRVYARDAEGKLMPNNEANLALVKTLLSEIKYERFTRNGFAELTQTETEGKYEIRDDARAYLTAEIVKDKDGNIQIEFTAVNSAALRLTYADGTELMVVTPGDANFDGVVNANDWTLIMRYTLEALNPAYDVIDFEGFTINGTEYDVWALMADMTGSKPGSNRSDMVNSNDWSILMQLTLQAWKK